jgi:hypothetical protein
MGGDSFVPALFLFELFLHPHLCGDSEAIQLAFAEIGTSEASLSDRTAQLAAILITAVNNDRRTGSIQEITEKLHAMEVEFHELNAQQIRYGMFDVCPSRR